MSSNDPLTQEPKCAKCGKDRDYPAHRLRYGAYSHPFTPADEPDPANDTFDELTGGLEYGKD